MKHTLTIVNDQVRARAMAIIGRLPTDPVHEVIIREHRASRSAQQQALQWLWYTHYGAGVGLTKDEVHEQCKERHCVPILIRDDSGYAEMWTAVMQTGSEAIRKQVIEMTSTTRLNVKQMAEYLTAIDREAASLGIALPHPEDRGLYDITR